ncbi:MAG: flagellar biosynthetic protein FliO [Anaerocolumna sp.]|jgi:flagellar protein FliO/FliZ|nr:flagellar biosynthetic protein FliO [Anaerocolumna sp.]
MQTKDFFEISMLLIIFIGVLFFTYFITKKIAVFNKKMVFNKNMKVVEVLQLGQGQYLYIVKIGNDYHVFGTSKENVNYCIRVEESDLNLEHHEGASFHEYLSRFMKGKQVNNHDKK